MQYMMPRDLHDSKIGIVLYKKQGNNYYFVNYHEGNWECELNEYYIEQLDIELVNCTIYEYYGKLDKSLGAQHSYINKYKEFIKQIMINDLFDGIDI